MDFGARYKHNIGYGGGIGPQAKNAADTERRQQSKQIIQDYLEKATQKEHMTMLQCP